MNKYYFLSIFCLSALNTFGQRTDTTSIYFPIDNFQIQTENQARISSAIRTPNIKSIMVTGYADYLGSVGYNLILSIKRAEAVKSFLMTKNDKLLITAEGKGQIDALVKDKTGNPKSRKVDVIIEYKALIVNTPSKVPDTIETKKPPITLNPTEDVAKGKIQFEAKMDSLFKGESGKSVTLNELNFEPGSHRLTRRSSLYLPILLKYLITYSDVKIMILGHICCQFNGKDGYDSDSKEYQLSTNRARAIYDYLVAHGISSHRMTYKGLGSDEPKVFPELTEEDRNLNRRVEISIENE